jgi:hypothetical protein
MKFSGDTGQPFIQTAGQSSTVKPRIGHYLKFGTGRISMRIFQQRGWMQQDCEKEVMSTVSKDSLS